MEKEKISREDVFVDLSKLNKSQLEEIKFLLNYIHIERYLVYGDRWYTWSSSLFTQKEISYTEFKLLFGADLVKERLKELNRNYLKVLDFAIKECENINLDVPEKFTSEFDSLISDIHDKVEKVFCDELEEETYEVPRFIEGIIEVCTERFSHYKYLIDKK